MRSSIPTLPLAHVPQHFASVTRSPSLSHFLSTLLEHVPVGGSACEVGCGSGYASVWLSQRSVAAKGLDGEARTAERAQHVNDILEGRARFKAGDPFHFYQAEGVRYDVIHHHGVLHRFAVPWIRALLAQQVTMADKVIFAVPSVFYSGQGSAEERLLPHEEWQRILEPFDVLDLYYYGDTRSGGGDYLLCILQGQEATEPLLEMMNVAEEPYPQGISAIIHTRNEERHMEACIETLLGWVDEIIVCDMESSDGTVEIARRFTDDIIYHPLLSNFDRARNVSAMRAKYRWVFYLDSDERVPYAFGRQLRDVVTSDAADFSAVATPFRTIFMGRWLKCIYPGFKAPPLYKNGKFVYNTALHAGASVVGRVLRTPPENPEASILHFSVDSVDDYLGKIKDYSTAEALNLDAAGQRYSWQRTVHDFVHDFQTVYDRQGAGRDGSHGFIWAFLGGIYRFAQHAKLYERHFRAGKLHESEERVPASLEEILEYALQVVRQRREAATPASSPVNGMPRESLSRQRQVEASFPLLPPAGGIETPTEGGTSQAVASPLSIRWEGTQFVWHSLAHVNREMCLVLLNSPGIDLSLVPYEGDQFRVDAEPRFKPLAGRVLAPLRGPASVHVRHCYPPRFSRPAEGHLVLMQPWEYGFLPKRWIKPLQENVSEVWCNSTYEKDVFIQSGVEEAKIHMIPLGINPDVLNPDVAPFLFTDEAGVEKTRALRPSDRQLNRHPDRPFTFLFVGGTIYRKGIDILLQAYLKAFTAHDDVCLLIKDAGTQTVYRGDNQRESILGIIDQDFRPALIYLDGDLASHEVAALYTAADCLVQPYRAEGFCLPVLEAMACGTAVIVTEGGPTDDFVDDTVGWRVPAERRPVDRAHIGVEEFVAEPWWFEVDPSALIEVMREAYGNRAEVRLRGEAGAKRVRENWTWQQASTAVLNRVQALSQVPVPLNPSLLSKEAAQHVRTGKAPRKQPTISLCMIVRDEERVFGACLESIKPYVDEIIVVDTGSVDRTVEIAKSFGARVFNFPWCEDFSAARNESLSHATGDWILWMDADDTMPEECAHRLHDLVFMAADDVTAYIAAVRIPPAPGESGSVVVDHVKLFRNLPALRFEGRIHEQILESIYRIDGKVERSDLYVVHSGYDYSPEGQQRKRERDLLLLQKDLDERPNHPFVLFNIGMTAYHLKDYDSALSALEKCLALSKPHESTVRKVYAMLAGCHLEKRDLQKAKSTVEAGLALFPHDPELLFRSGTILREAGELKAAEMAYLKLLNAPETGHIDSVDVSIKGFKAHHNLGLVYQEMGQPGKAEEQWQAALVQEPRFIPSQHALTDLYLQTGRHENARVVIRNLHPVAPALAADLTRKLTLLNEPARH